MFCLLERINHFSLIYKVVLAGPQQTLSVFTTSPQRYFSGLGRNNGFSLHRKSNAFHPTGRWAEGIPQNAAHT